MRNPFWLVLLLCNTCVSLWGQVNTINKIEAVLAAETVQYQQRTMGEVIADFWILDEATRLTISFHDGVVLHLNAEQMSGLQMMALENVLENKIEDLKVGVVDTLAHCSYTRVVRLKDSEVFLYSHEIRVLEWIGNAWKTHLASIHYYQPTQ
jgi:argininosuccinate synthase